MEPVLPNQQPRSQYQPSSSKRATIFKILMKYLFSHLGLLVLVSAYCAGGAFLFINIEHDNTNLQRQSAINRSGDIEQQRQDLAAQLWMYKWSNNFNETARALITQYHKNVSGLMIDVLEYKGAPLTTNDIKDPWIFPSALLFTITIVTTIGYGNVVPKTPTGQLTVIFYALLGVPLMLMFLANIGELMANFFRMAYGRGCCYICWKRRKANYEVTEKRMREKKEQLQKQHGPNVKVKMDEEMINPDAETINVPISLTLVVIAAYLFIGAILFSTWNDWSLSKGTYFSFVTLSTVGFGDLIPGWDTVGTVTGNLKMVISCIYIVFGLAVLSMSFNLMMEEMMAKFHWLGLKLGIIDDEQKSEDKKPLVANEHTPNKDVSPDKFNQLNSRHPYSRPPLSQQI